MTHAADLAGEARSRAEEVLLSNCGPAGLAAGEGYRQIWTRDVVVAGLGLAVCSDERGRGAARPPPPETVGARQSELGRLPNNVPIDGEDPALAWLTPASERRGANGPSDEEAQMAQETAHSGCVDNNLWYILGWHVLTAVEGASGLDTPTWDRLERAHLWLRYQDSNECGLLEVHEAMDWADLFANRYNSLLPNVLWFAANKAMSRLARLAGRPEESVRGYQERAADIGFKLNQLLWVGPEVIFDAAWARRHRVEWLHPRRLVEVTLQERPYFLPYIAFRDFGDRFDSLGNLLAVLLGVAGAAQSARILDYVRGAGVDLPWPVKAAWPVIAPNERDWREYYRVRNLNQPYQYHNGGCWPFLGGFYVAALVRAGRQRQAAEILDRLAEMNRCSTGGEPWEFNEWFHGVSGQPMGLPRQSWSAGLYVYAHEAVTSGRAPVFGDELLW